MSALEPVATVFLVSALAAMAAGLGALPQAVRGLPSPALIGWGNALAGGLMLGVAYTLMGEAVGGATLAGGMGALLGIAVVRATHAATGTGRLDSEAPEATELTGRYTAVLGGSLHSAHEGIAVGVAMAVSLPLGVAMAATLGIHNIPEAMALNGSLSRRGVPLWRSAVLSTAVNVNQVILAVLAFWALAMRPGLLPGMAGFAGATLMYLTLSELLPESYRQAGHRSIALVTLLALGMVVLLAGVAA